MITITPASPRVPPPRRARGLIKDNGRYARMPFQLLANRLGATPRGSADIDAYAPQILDQNGASSCVMHGVPCAICTTLAAKGTPLPWVPSQREGYSMALGLDRAAANPMVAAKRLPPLVDFGTMLMSGVKVAQKWGFVPMGPKVTWHGVEVESDCSPANATLEPDLVTLQKASRRLVVGAYQAFFDLNKSAQLSLDAGMSVALGNFVDMRHFHDYDGKTPLGAQDFSDREGGGHCTYLTSYRTENGKVIYDGRNSWGTGWGIDGKFECTADFIKEAWEVIIVDVRLL